MATTSLPTAVGKTRVVENRLDLAIRIIQHTLDLIDLEGFKRGRHLLTRLK